MIILFGSIFFLKQQVVLSFHMIIEYLMSSIICIYNFILKIITKLKF